MGLLHDIGRIYSVTDCKHVLDGYRLMYDMGYEDVAKICLTHSFPYRRIEAYGGGKFDITEDEYHFLQEFISSTEYNDYDKLIQLSDALANQNGVCYIEKRLIDEAIRHGIGEYTVEKWKAFLNLKKHFDDSANMNVYDLFEITTK